MKGDLKDVVHRHSGQLSVWLDVEGTCRDGLFHPAVSSLIWFVLLTSLPSFSLQPASGLWPVGDDKAKASCKHSMALYLWQSFNLLQSCHHEIWCHLGKSWYAFLSILFAIERLPHRFLPSSFFAYQHSALFSEHGMNKGFFLIVWSLPFWCVHVSNRYPFKLLNFIVRLR